MANFGDKVQLLKKSLNREFVGISEDKCEDNLLITFDNNITIYDTSNKRVTRSWSVDKAQKITSRAIYNKEDDEYVFVVNHNIIHTSSQTNFDNVEKFTVSCDIFTILPDCHDESLVVFTNGQIMQLAKVFEDPKFQPRPNKLMPNDDKIVLCKQIDLDEKYLVCLCSSAEEHYLIFSDVAVNNQSEEIKIPVKSDSHRLCSAAFHDQSNSQTVFVTLWGNHTLCKSTITSQSLQSKSLEFTEIVTMELPKNILFSSLCFLSSDLLAVVCKEDKKICVAVFDLKFGLCHGKISNLSNNVQIERLGELLLLIEEGSISGVSFTTSSVNLLTAFKKETNLSTNLASQALWSTNTTEVEKPNKTTEKHLKILQNSKKGEELMKSWKFLWKNQSESQKKILASSPFLSQLLARISDDKLWIPDVIEEIVSTGFISSSSCPCLVQKVLEQRDFHLLGVCLKNLQNIFEKDIVSCLDLVIKCEESGTNIDEMNDVEDILVSVLSLPCTEARLKDELRNLSFKKVLVLLGNLCERLKLYSLKSDKVLSFDQVISWISIILDAHLTQFVMSSDAWEVLVKLQDTVNTQVEIFEEVYQINILLTKIKESLKRPKKQNRFTYRVDVMTI